MPTSQESGSWSPVVAFLRLRGGKGLYWTLNTKMECQSRTPVEGWLKGYWFTVSSSSVLSTSQDAEQGRMSRAHGYISLHILKVSYKECKHLIIFSNRNENLQSQVPVPQATQPKVHMQTQCYDLELSTVIYKYTACTTRQQKAG